MLDSAASSLAWKSVYSSRSGEAIQNYELQQNDAMESRVAELEASMRIGVKAESNEDADTLLMRMLKDG